MGETHIGYREIQEILAKHYGVHPDNVDIRIYVKYDDDSELPELKAVIYT